MFGLFSGYALFFFDSYQSIGKNFKHLETLKMSTKIDCKTLKIRV